MYIPSFIILYSGRTNWALEDYSHIYFILPISIFIVWQKREVLKGLLQKVEDSAAGAFFSFILLLGGILLFIFGWRNAYDLVFIFSLVPVLLGLTGYLYGSNVARALSFPILYLLFLVPAPPAILDTVTLSMRYGVSFTAEKMLSLFTYPVTRKGLLLSIGYNEIYMAPACSGFRSLITMSALSLPYIYLIKGRLLNKVILAVSVIPLALIGNLTRVITISLITFYFGPEAGQGFLHNFSGILIFMVTILGLISIESLVDRFTAGISEITDAKDE